MIPPPENIPPARASILRMLVVATLLVLMLAACTSGISRPVADGPAVDSATTTSAVPRPTTTIVAPPPVPTTLAPAPSTDCATDVAAAEKVMFTHAVSDLNTSGMGELAALLASLQANCTKDFVSRWTIEVYHPWTKDGSITPGTVPVDVVLWPPDWFVSAPTEDTAGDVTGAAQPPQSSTTVPTTTTPTPTTTAAPTSTTTDSVVEPGVADTPLPDLPAP